MNEGTKKRAALDFGNMPVATQRPRIDPDAVKAAAREVGFRETPREHSSDAASNTPKPKRRTRRKTGRTEQFATRLREDTILAIHNYADQYEITLAETIERAVSALKQVESNDK